MPVSWEVDPVSEDAANVPLALGEPRYRMTAMSVSAPPVEGVYATSMDTEGDPPVGYRHRNRVVGLEYLVLGSTDAALEASQTALQLKIDKLRRERGTLKFTSQTGKTAVGDVLNVTLDELTLDRRYVRNRVIPVKLQFECRPYFRGAPVLLADHAETTLPCLIFTETGLAGDVPGLGRLVIDEDQAQNQLWLVWGLRSRYEGSDGATTAALFFQAESRTLLNGATTQANGSASGGTVVKSGALTTTYQAIISSQATGGGSHLSHIGTYRVFASVQPDVFAQDGTLSVALEWSVGDFRQYKRNGSTEIPSTPFGGTPTRLIDLGLVHVPKVAQGTQRWEFRLIAKSTVAGDDFYADYFVLVPVDEGSGEVSANARPPAAPTSLTARDEFDQTAGALTGKTLPIGGTWIAAGVAGDFAVEATGHTAQRASQLDSSPGRVAIADATAMTDAYVAVDYKATAFGSIGGIAPENYCGVVARYVDASNYASAFQGRIGNDHFVFFAKRIAGSTFIVQAVQVPAVSANTWYGIALSVTADGRWTLYHGAHGRPDAIYSDTDSSLATGGTLASGKPGLLDFSANPLVVTRNYDNFIAWPLVADAALFASQSLEIRHDRTIREDSAGAVWQEPSAYEGDYLHVPPAGGRFIVKAARQKPGVFAQPDQSADDISARLTYTPRYLVLPS